MNKRIYFGKLFDIKDGIDALPKIYHIHSVKPDFPRCEVGVIKSSFDLDKRDSLNAGKNIREKVFEELRKLKFSDYPSRDQCLFAIRMDEIPIWMEHFAPGLVYFQILRIELISGKLIILDDSLYDYNCENSEYISDSRLAQYYWDGDSLEGKVKPVFLFEGKFEVKEIIKEKSHNLLFNK